MNIVGSVLSTGVAGVPRQLALLLPGGCCAMLILMLILPGKGREPSWNLALSLGRRF